MTDIINWLRDKIINNNKEITLLMKDSYLLFIKLFGEIKENYDYNTNQGKFLDLLAFKYGSSNYFKYKPNDIKVPFILLRDSVVKESINKTTGFSFYYKSINFAINDEEDKRSYILKDVDNTKKIKIYFDIFNYSKELTKENYFLYIGKEYREKKALNEIINLVKEVNQLLKESISFYLTVDKIFKNNITDLEIKEFVEKNKENIDILIAFLHTDNPDLSVKIINHCVENDIKIDKEEIISKLNKYEANIDDYESFVNKTDKYMKIIINEAISTYKEIDFISNIELHNKLSINFKEEKKITKRPKI